MSLQCYHVTFLDGSGWYMPLWGLTKSQLGVDSPALVMAHETSWNLNILYLNAVSFGWSSGLPSEEMGDS